MNTRGFWGTNRGNRGLYNSNFRDSTIRQGSGNGVNRAIKSDDSGAFREASSKGRGLSVSGVREGVKDVTLDEGKREPCDGVTA